MRVFDFCGEWLSTRKWFWEGPGFEPGRKGRKKTRLQPLRFALLGDSFWVARRFQRCDNSGDDVGL